MKKEAELKDVKIPNEKLKKMYYDMLLIRRFEEKSAQMYQMGKISGFCHLYVGQEAVAVGATAAIKDDDYVITAYRDHGHCLARGTDPNVVMAELYGKGTGCSKGKGGSMHLFDVERNFLGGFGIVGGHIPLALGYAFASRYKNENRVILCFFGDGAVAQGSFHESLNLAALWNLPVVFICENNLYGMGTYYKRALAHNNIFEQAPAYEVAGYYAEGNNVFDVYQKVKEAVDLARKERKPTLIEARTYRYRGHSMSDPALYRTKEEVENYKKSKDCLLLYKEDLLEGKVLKEEDFKKMDDKVKKVVAEAVEFSEKSPEPPLDSLYEDIYV